MTPTLFLISCVLWGRLIHQLEYQFFHLLKEDELTPASWGVCEAPMS